MRRPLDCLGLALLSPRLTLFLYRAERISQPAGGASFAAGILMTAAFLWMAWQKGDDALIDLRLFRSKIFSAAALTQFLSNGVPVRRPGRRDSRYSKRLTHGADGGGGAVQQGIRFLQTVGA